MCGVFRLEPCVEQIFLMEEKNVNGCKINHILNKYDVVYEMKCDFICVSLYHPLSFVFSVIVGRKR